jgi:hypothetical protein
MVQYFDFVQFCCVLLTLTFAFVDFKSLMQNFGFIKSGSNLAMAKVKKVNITVTWPKIA